MFSISSGYMKLKPYSYRQVIKTLSKLGFKTVRQRGSHVVLKGFYKEMNRTVVVPKHNEIAMVLSGASYSKQELRLRNLFI
jgi:predicted RNA binding protein YcfA (HicA-like mRNA interferase family)